MFPGASRYRTRKGRTGNVWASIPLHDLILLALLGRPFVLWAFAISVVIAAWIWLAVNAVYMIRADCRPYQESQPEPKPDWHLTEILGL
jgi:hypothetical protein